MITKVKPSNVLLRFDGVGLEVTQKQYDAAIESLKGSLLAVVVGLDDLKPHEELLLLLLRECGLIAEELNPCAKS